MVDAPLLSSGELKERLSRRALNHAKAAHSVIRIKRGLYAIKASNDYLDPFAVLNKGFKDPVVSHHSALELHGYASTYRRIFTAYTETDQRPFRFRGNTFTAFAYPKALRLRNCADEEVIKIEMRGLTLKATSLERTLVDCLARPSLTGGLEEIRRAFKAAATRLDPQRLCRYALALENKTLVGLLGVILDQQSSTLTLSHTCRQRLRAKLPNSPHYVLAHHGTGVLIRKWNVIVPRALAHPNSETGSGNRSNANNLRQAVPPRMQAAAKSLAKRYIWWEPAEKTLQNLPRFLSHTMNLATWEDQAWIERHFPTTQLNLALSQAPAGTFTPRSWNYWHVRLGKPTPPLPKKQIPT